MAARVIENRRRLAARADVAPEDVVMSWQVHGADIREWEQVAVLDIDNGARFETYAASAQRFGNIVAQAGADVHASLPAPASSAPAVATAALAEASAAAPDTTGDAAQTAHATSPAVGGAAWMTDSKSTSAA